MPSSSVKKKISCTKNDLIKQSDMQSIKNITFLDSIKKEDVPKYLSICNIALVPLKKDETFQNVIPSKIFEAAALQVPILLGVDGESKVILEDYSAGIFYKPEDSNDFLQKIKMFQDKNFYQKCQKGCKDLAKNYNRKKLANNMLGIINEVYSTNKNK